MLLTGPTATREPTPGRPSGSYGRPNTSRPRPFRQAEGARGARNHIRHGMPPVSLQGRRFVQFRARRGGPMAKYRIENVVASTSLGHELDLKAISLALGGSEYEPEQFPGLIYRIKEPKTAILLFRSGKVVCTGAKSLENVKAAIAMIAKQIEAAGIPIKKDPENYDQSNVATSER